MREHLIPVSVNPQIEKLIKIECCGFCKGEDPLLPNGRMIEKNEYVLHIFTKGTGVYTNEAKVIQEFNENTVIISYPNRWHAITPKKGHLLEHLYITCSGELIENLFLDSKNGNVELFKILKNKLYEKKYFDILELVRLESSYAIHKAHALLYELIIDTLHLHAETNANLRYSLVDNFIAYIKRNIKAKELDTLNFLKPLKIGKNQFVHTLKKETGKTPHQFWLWYKISVARSLLVETNLTIKEIAWQLGFDDELYFSRLFKRKEGRSPKNYRKHFI